MLTPTDDHVNPASLERIVPDEITANETTGAETLRLHMERYKFAKRKLVRGSVLDLACGVGYGTALLGEHSEITDALGVDISPSSVQYAAQRYSNERVSFCCSDALQFRPGRVFDNIVSLETIEHVDNPRAVFAHLVSLLAPKGRLIASVPITPSVDANPHHKTNFSVRTFRLLASGFPLNYLDSLTQAQPFNPVAIGLRKETRAGNLRQNLPWFYLQNPSHLALRIWSTLRDGFVNKYITIVWERSK
jgi:SAM-dependent methyltransferase